MPYSAPKKSVKEVRYLNKDFTSFKNNLIEFTKIYFPNQYNDFNESSPGMMFIEMASYVGDVLSYYIDNQFKESLLAFAEEKKTVYNMAQSLGYKPKLATAASVGLDIFQTVPATSTGTGDGYETKPDLSYALNIKSGMEYYTGFSLYNIYYSVLPNLGDVEKSLKMILEILNEISENEFSIKTIKEIEIKEQPNINYTPVQKIAVQTMQHYFPSLINIQYKDDLNKNNFYGTLTGEDKKDNVKKWKNF